MYSDEMIAALTSDRAMIGYAAKISFPDNEVRYFTGVGEIAIEGEIYTGTGELGEVGQLQVTGDDKPSELTLTLSGIPGDVLSSALLSNARGSDVTVYILSFNNESYELELAEVALIGYVADYKVTAGSTNKVEVTVGDEFELYELTWARYWTDESFKHDHDDDRLCRYTSQMGDRTLYWGSEDDAPAFTSDS